MQSEEIENSDMNEEDKGIIQFADLDDLERMDFSHAEMFAEILESFGYEIYYIHDEADGFVFDYKKGEALDVDTEEYEEVDEVIAKENLTCIELWNGWNIYAKYMDGGW